MEKFIYSYDCGDEFTASWTNYIAFESESKETLITELTCAVIDFKKFQEDTWKKIEDLRAEGEKTRLGGNKKDPDFEKYRQLYLEERKLEEQTKKFTFKNKQYDFEYFVEWTNNSSYKKSTYEIRDIERNIESLDEWFEGMK